MTPADRRAQREAEKDAAIFERLRQLKANDPTKPVSPSAPVGRRTGLNFRKNNARREAARENYPALVLLEACPTCGAKATAWCKETKGRPRPVPHDERVDLANLGRGW